MVRACSLVSVLALWSGQAVAWTGTVDWPTFYRAGPAKGYAVLEELDRGRTLDVLSCQGDWCEVRNGRGIGYVELGALAPQSAPPASDGKAAECFDSRSNGYKKGRLFRYCPQPGG